MAIRIKRKGKHTQIIVPGDASDLSIEIRLKVIDWLASGISRQCGGADEIEFSDDDDDTK